MPDMMELLLFFASGFVAVVQFIIWYEVILAAWPPERTQMAKYVLGALPVFATAIILVTLLNMASFDVVGAPFYIIMYLLMGYVWVQFSPRLMFRLFDLSWRDDVLNMDNRAALIPLVGGYLGTTVIYAGANIGDGPGWWCVLVAGGLGLAAWALLGRLVAKLTGAFEQITVGRDVGCGIRMGCYLLASGIILGRASGGDWTSFGATLVEFLDGSPALLLAAGVILLERVFRESREKNGERGNDIPISVIVGVMYLLLVLLGVLLLPSI